MRISKQQEETQAPKKEDVPASQGNSEMTGAEYRAERALMEQIHEIGLNCLTGPREERERYIAEHTVDGKWQHIPTSESE